MRLLIIGGVAGGAAAAARARRLSEDSEIIVFERGGYISYATCGLPYYVGGVIERKDDLVVQTPERLKKRFKLDIRTFSEVVEIDRANK
ncbi:MAG: FAD-dependent oxidoreductase, partial [Candidatus Omnitrophica bacterium]|nr:FAD-dependent oxidoreductase [Candidatus Omnitrophota bacterium]